MEGFYTKEQTAEMLGVSSRTVSNYMRDGHIRVIYSGKRAWLPKEDVQRMYDRAKSGLGPGSEDLEEIKSTIAKLVHEVEVLKLGLGFGAKAKPRTDLELLLLRQKFMDMLSEGRWSRKQLSGIADDLIGVQESELLLLIDKAGPTAWIPLQELTMKMLFFIENQPEYPGQGLDILESRLIRAKERFLGLVYSTSKVPSKASGRAKELHEALSPPGGLDQAILTYIKGLK